MVLEVQRQIQLRHDIAAAELRLEQLELRRQKLSEELEMASDQSYREGLVRQMGYVHRDERLFLQAAQMATPPVKPSN